MYRHDDKFFTIVVDEWQRREIELKAAAYGKKVDQFIFEAVREYAPEIMVEGKCPYCKEDLLLTRDDPYIYAFEMGDDSHELTVLNVPQRKCPSCRMYLENAVYATLMQEALDSEVLCRPRLGKPLTDTINFEDLLHQGDHYRRNKK